MIALVTGAPGAGKSYYAVRVLADALMTGKPVATNIALMPGWERRVANLNPLNRVMPWRRRRVEKRLTDNLFVSAELEEIFRVRVAGSKEGRFIIVLDEAHNWMNARTWDQGEKAGQGKAEAVQARLKVVRYFSQHRKLGADVYCITQDAQNIDRQVRSLFEYHIRLKALHNFKVAGVRLLPFKYFLAIWFWNDGAKTIVKRQGYPLTGIRRIYDTMALSHGLEDDEAAPILLPANASPAAPAAATGAAGRPDAASADVLPDQDDAAATPAVEGGARASSTSSYELTAPAPLHLTSPAVSAAVSGLSSDAPAKVPHPMDPAAPPAHNVERPGWNRVALGGPRDAARGSEVTE